MQSIKTPETAQKEFVKKLKNITQSSDCESEFIEAFKETPKDTFFDLIAKIYPKLTIVCLTINSSITTYLTKRYVKVFENIDSLDEYANSMKAY